MITTILSLLAAVLAGVLFAVGFGVWYVRRLIAHAGRDLRVMPFTSRQPPPGPEVELGGGYGTLPAEEPPPTKPVRLPVVQAKGKCGACDSWSLEAGQRVMDAHPAFRAAAQWRQPWQMGQRRNPAYMGLEKQIYEAEKTSGDDSAKELRAELAATPEWLGEQSDLKKTLKTQWGDFGACAHHHELRARTDGCEHFVPAEVES